MVIGSTAAVRGYQCILEKQQIEITPTDSYIFGSVHTRNLKTLCLFCQVCISVDR